MERARRGHGAAGADQSVPPTPPPVASASPTAEGSSWRRRAADAMLTAVDERCTPLYGFALAHNEAAAAAPAPAASPGRLGSPAAVTQVHRGAGQWVQWTQAGRGNGNQAALLRHNVSASPVPAVSPMRHAQASAAGTPPPSARDRHGQPLPRGTTPKETKSSRLRRLRHHHHLTEESPAPAAPVSFQDLCRGEEWIAEDDHAAIPPPPPEECFDAGNAATPTPVRTPATASPPSAYSASSPPHFDLRRSAGSESGAAMSPPPPHADGDAPFRLKATVEYTGGGRFTGNQYWPDNGDQLRVGDTGTVVAVDPCQAFPYVCAFPDAAVRLMRGDLRGVAPPRGGTPYVKVKPVPPPAASPLAPSQCAAVGERTPGGWDRAASLAAAFQRRAGQGAEGPPAAPPRGATAPLGAGAACLPAAVGAQAVDPVFTEASYGQWKEEAHASEAHPSAHSEQGGDAAGSTPSAKTPAAGAGAASDAQGVYMPPWVAKAAGLRADEAGARARIAAGRMDSASAANLLAALRLKMAQDAPQGGSSTAASEQELGTPSATSAGGQTQTPTPDAQVKDSRAPPPEAGTSGSTTHLPSPTPKEPSRPARPVFMTA
eukprot:TRINITY_DN8625_c0_g1_i1.p1 TRINITY_DN8625_c0_g1~~TRINITY_DN8625_c0_g1_i1.p1  ORF type:complete len:602 (+),score=88.00 TRINITY_DN8625_c0_g1_i1:117-1922(+)